MQVCTPYLAPLHTVRYITPKRVRRARTLRVLGLLVCLTVFLFGPRVVETFSRTNIPPVVSHTVAPGESLWEIASQYGSGEDPRQVITRIKHYNGLASSTLQPGQQILIPVQGRR